MTQSNSVFSGRTTVRQLALAIFLAVAVLYYRFGAKLGFKFGVVTYVDARIILVNVGYWATAGTALIFAIALCEEIRTQWRGWATLKQHWPGLLIGALVAVFWQVHEPHDFKVLFDEHVLGGVARNMHFMRIAAFDTYGHIVDSHFIGMQGQLDKRPLLYPFLVSIAHDLTGYRPENSFLVNGLLGFVLLMFTYMAGVAMGGKRIGCLGQLLLAGLPLLAQNATDGGFDMLNVAMLCGLLVAGWNYWRQPGTGGLDLWIMSGLMIANSRYESLDYLGATALLVLFKWLRERQVTLTWAAAFSPVLVLLPLLVMEIFTGSEGNFQTSKENFININHIYDNFGNALLFLFTQNYQKNDYVVLSILGSLGVVIALVVLLTQCPRNLRGNGAEMPLLVLLLVVLGNTFLTLNLSWGDWNDPFVGRFSLPLHLAFAWCVMFVAAKWLAGRLLPRCVLVAAGLSAVVVAAPASSLAYTTRSHDTYNSYSWVRDYMLKHGDNTTLTVTRASLMYTLYGWPSIPFSHANGDPEKVMNVIGLGIYHDVWVVQEMVLNGKLNAWVERTEARLDHRLKLETIAEYPVSTVMHIRISRVVGYDGTQPPGTLRLLSEVGTGSDKYMKELAPNYEPPIGTDTSLILSQRPEDEPAAIPTLSELGDDRDKLVEMIYKNLP